ncbi:restriction endonuclease subunit S [Sphingobacterium composti Ten et al. 2007 non Yoo et al. 2007]|uniref:restriction endonuclease subunit S n=1 Tax=Sphingobacterium composti TaxID=363260 RepID=UPI00135757BD|nr:restriction endonuclease subunit S [Sphingobacterium composti Ten et al. 2007 non Yoo et al. 2007]
MNRFISLNSFISKQKSGDWGRDSYDEKYNFKVHCVRGADINAVNEGKYDCLPLRYIESKNKAKLLEEGNIIIEISGGSPSQSTGRVSYVGGVYKNIICSNFCRAYEIQSEYSAKYFYYLIKNIYNSNVFFNFESKTTGIKNLLIESAFNNIKVPEFDLPTQQKIAAVLSALDDKIELNNKINAELEAMAKTLYDYWFVQFEFPYDFAQDRPNAEGKPYKSSGGKMLYNPTLKREIPEGWEVSVFNDWIKQTKTGDWGKEKIEGNYTERVFCVRGADINGLNGKGEVKAPERYILKNNLSKKLEDNDFIIEISGGSPTQSTARIALLTKETLERFDTNVVCSNFCKAVTLKETVYAFNFQQEWQRLYDAGVFFGFEGKTSGIKNFLFDSFMDSYHIVKPPKELAQKYNSFAKELEKKKQLNLKQNQELAQLRDWLLPMLMNGQVKVEDTYSSSEQQTNIAAEAAIAYQN